MITDAVSKIGLDADGRVASVLWGQVDTDRNDRATDEAITLFGTATFEREVHDMAGSPPGADRGWRVNRPCRAPSPRCVRASRAR